MTVTCEDYGLLYRMAENNQHPKVRLDLDASLLGEQPTFNVIGQIKGVEKPNEYVILSAHFDSWDGGSGSTDNGTGTLMTMEAMRLLKLAYPHPKRTILVGHWASEEQGLNGSTAFNEDHPDIVKATQAVFNQDNGTGRVQTLSAQGLTETGKHLKMWYEHLPAFYTDSMSSNVVSWSPSGCPMSRRCTPIASAMGIVRKSAPSAACTCRSWRCWRHCSPPPCGCCRTWVTRAPVDSWRRAPCAWPL